MHCMIMEIEKTLNVTEVHVYLLLYSSFGGDTAV